MKRLLSMLLIIIMVMTCYGPAFASERTLVDSTSEGKQRVREIQELRQENSDTYLLSDGTCECVVYSEDKYFKNENGNYVVINNAVKPEKYKSVSNDYGFANAANSFKVRFSDKKASVLITTESECLAFSLINSEPKNVKAGAEGNSYRFQEFNLRSNNCITYVDAYKDADIIYSVQNDYVKEYIVLKSPAAQSEFLFEVDTSNYDITKENNPYNFSSAWQTAINQSRYKWNNSSAPVNFYTSSNSNNRIYVSQYDYKAYGITYALELSGNELTKFKIELNSRTIMSAASAGSLENFIQSVLVHELGHTIWLADNPVTEKDSIMKYTRDRNTMVSPTAYDISNVAAKYNKNGGK